MFQNKVLIPSREDQVYEAIKEGILRGDLKPNEVVSQSEIARQLGVSIIPVRSAMSRLLAEGLLRQNPYHSPQVSSLTQAELDEVLLIGMHLEMLATRESIPSIGPEEMEKLYVLLNEMEQALEDGRLLEFGQLNRTFHMAIYQSCPYPRLRQMIQDLWDKADINRYRAIFDLVPEMARHAQDDHARLLQLIETRKVDEAVKLVEAHKLYSRRSFLIAYQNINTYDGDMQKDLNTKDMKVLTKGTKD
jgi:DNA-binding GntR family transcriptional regulator